MPEDRLRTPGVDDLLDALLALEARDEAYALLLDLCTIREIHDMAQRLHVARMLAAGEHYTRIQEVTGASATTISRVSKCLNYGADGYRTVLERLWPDQLAPVKAVTSADGEPSTPPSAKKAGR
jgi:TrpR-related protein YerC/YecD